jgi:hypothetical protein
MVGVSQFEFRSMSAPAATAPAPANERAIAPEPELMRSEDKQANKPALMVMIPDIRSRTSPIPLPFG